MYCSDKRLIPQDPKGHVLEERDSGKAIPAKYRKRILSVDQVWNFYRDCRVCPVLLNKRSLEIYISESSDLDSSKVNYFLDDIAVYRKTASGSSLSAAQALEQNLHPVLVEAVIVCSPQMISPERKLTDRRVSFQTFVKVVIYSLGLSCL